MSKNNWKSCTVKKYKATTNSIHQHPVIEPNQSWLTSIKYILMIEVWLYIVRVMDLYSRKIVGSPMDITMIKDLIINAF